MENAKAAAKATMQGWQKIPAVYDITDEMISDIDNAADIDAVNTLVYAAAATADGKVVAFRNNSYTTHYLGSKETVGNEGLSSTVANGTSATRGWVLKHIENTKTFTLRNALTGFYIADWKDADANNGAKIPVTENASDATPILITKNGNDDNVVLIDMIRSFTNAYNGSAQYIQENNASQPKVWGSGTASSKWVAESLTMPTEVTVDPETKTLIPGTTDESSFKLSGSATDADGETVSTGFDAVEVTIPAGAPLTSSDVSGEANAKTIALASGATPSDTPIEISVASTLKGLSIPSTTCAVTIGKPWLTGMSITIDGLTNDTYSVEATKVGDEIIIPFTPSAAVPAGLNINNDNFSIESIEGVTATIETTGDNAPAIKLTGINATDAEQSFTVTLSYTNEEGIEAIGNKITAKTFTLSVPAVTKATGFTFEPASGNVIYLDQDGNADEVSVTATITPAGAVFPSDAKVTIATSDNAITLQENKELTVSDGQVTFTLTPAAVGTANVTLTLPTAYGDVTGTYAIEMKSGSITLPEGTEATQEKVLVNNDETDNNVKIPVTLTDLPSGVTIEAELNEGTGATVSFDDTDNKIVVTPSSKTAPATVKVSVKAVKDGKTYATLSTPVTVNFTLPEVGDLVADDVEKMFISPDTSVDFSIAGTYTPDNADFDADNIKATTNPSDGITLQSAVKGTDNTFSIAGNATKRGVYTVTLTYEADGKTLATKEVTVAIKNPALALAEGETEEKSLELSAEENAENSISFILNPTDIPDGVEITPAALPASAASVTYDKDTNTIKVTAASITEAADVNVSATAEKDGTFYATLTGLKAKFTLPAVKNITATAADVTLIDAEVPFTVIGSYAPSNAPFDPTKLTVTPVDGLEFETPDKGTEGATFTITGKAKAKGNYTINLCYENSETSMVTAAATLDVISGINKIEAKQPETVILQEEEVAFKIEGTFAPDAATFDATKLTASAEGLNFDPAARESGNAFSITGTATKSGEYEITLIYDNGAEAKPTAKVSLTVSAPAPEEGLTTKMPEETDTPENVKVEIKDPIDGSTQEANIEFEIKVDTEGEKTITLPAANEVAEGTIIDFNALYVAIADDETIATATVGRDGSVTVQANENGNEGITVIRIWHVDKAPAKKEINLTALTDEAEATPEMIITVSVVNTRAENVTITGLSSNSSVLINRPVTFTASITPAEAGNGIEWSVEGGSYELKPNDDGSATITFTEYATYKVTATVSGSVPAVKSMMSVNVISGTITGIGEINADAIDADAVIYDLAGRRLIRVASPGVYIINGVKTLVK
ncbi:MAG: hypothetical protein NC484_01790 [Alloprevotella sp.]|nr:hypothetical protein [Alloprevotella sp.]